MSFFVQTIHLTDAALSRSINTPAVRTSPNATSALVYGPVYHVVPYLRFPDGTV